MFIKLTTFRDTQKRINFDYIATYEACDGGTEITYDDGCYEKVRESVDEIDTALGLTEMHKPKKFIKGRTTAERLCPTCGKTVNWIGYPCRCGQMIDWSEVE